MQGRYSNLLPGARFEGIGEMIFRSLRDSGSLDMEKIPKHLRVDRLKVLPFYDTIKKKVGQLYLAKSFTVTITLRSGRNAAGQSLDLPSGSFPNHIGTTFPP